MSDALRRAYRWHRPLMIVAGVMLLCAAISVIGTLADPRVILGSPAWAKPLKFSLSICIYAVTWAWLIAHLPRWRRLTHALGTVIALTLSIEQALIVWAAATGTTSHFNISNGLHTAVWATMAAAITVMYLCTLVTSAAAFFMNLPTPAITLALRAGVVIALAGIAVAFLMTAPTTEQLNNPSGIAGAHAVGAIDGGPGVPLLGWSTEGGDYRVAHFIGMHALQVIPLAAIGLSAAARRFPRLSPPKVQLRLVAILSLVYAAAVALLTAQAAAGQSVINPDGIYLAAGWIITSVCLLSIALTLRMSSPQLQSVAASKP